MHHQAPGRDRRAANGTLPDPQVAGLLTGVGLLRLAVLMWAAVVVVVDVRGTADIHAAGAVGLLVALFGWTGLIAWCTRRRPQLLVDGPLVPLDVAIGALVAAADHLVYDGPHPQTFASAWPLGAVVSAGVLRGPRGGGAAGVVVGLAGALGTASFATGGLSGRATQTIGSLVLLTIAGVLAGVVTDALRRAERSVARAAAREEFARDLHDGVLQTLAVVQRRSDDPALVDLARDQELRLRQFIGGPGSTAQVATGGTLGDTAGAGPTAGLVAALRAALLEAERRTGVRCELVVVDEVAWVRSDAVVAVCNAVTEAITNADKHGGAARVVVCLDRHEDGARCTVTDDGIGFDPGSVAEGVGLSRSIRGRLADVGGSVEIVSRPGRGCEVRLDVPRSSGRDSRRF